MQRECDRCGRLYEAKNSRSRFCSDLHRAEAGKARKAGLPERVAGVAVLPPEPSEEGPQALATRIQLEVAERFDSPLGQACMALAKRMDARIDNGSGLASLVRELRTTLEAALDGAARAPDVVDELRARRERRRA